MRFILAFLMFSALSSNAQEAENYFLYFDKEWKPCDSIQAVYKRQVYITPFDYVYSDYLVEKNSLIGTGSFLDSSLTIRTGKFESYHILESADNYSYLVATQGTYCNNMPCGIWSAYDLNGIAIISETYSDQGQLNGTSEWLSRGKSSYYTDSTKTYVNGLLHGPTSYYSFGHVRAIFHYNYGKLDSVVYYNDQDERINSDEPTDRPAIYEGGEQALQKTIRAEQQYPEEAKKQHISGTVKVCFVVNCYGEIEDIAVVESIHPLLDAEAIRIVSVLGYFYPALQNNCEISSTVCLEIKF
ncbi:MAG: TonB family protein [Crocinitomicaceae bacterium]|nr:TonB family protein [Crocinitomicaceae bacterium]